MYGSIIVRNYYAVLPKSARKVDRWLQWDFNAQSLYFAKIIATAYNEPALCRSVEYYYKQKWNNKNCTDQFVFELQTKTCQCIADYPLSLVTLSAAIGWPRWFVQSPGSWMPDLGCRNGSAAWRGPSVARLEEAEDGPPQRTGRYYCPKQTRCVFARKGLTPVHSVGPPQRGVRPRPLERATRRAITVVRKNKQ
jgi:hypothetical protein